VGGGSVPNPAPSSCRARIGGFATDHIAVFDRSSARELGEASSTVRRRRHHRLCPKYVCPRPPPLSKPLNFNERCLIRRLKNETNGSAKLQIFRTVMANFLQRVPVIETRR
jgi:hypothetical protein